MPNDPQVPWTDEQWARVNQVVQEEAKRARVAATFLPLYGPLDADADFVRRQEILYAEAGATRTERPPRSQRAARLQQRYGGRRRRCALAAQERFARPRHPWTPALGHRRQGHDPACDAAGDCARAQRADGRSRDGERAGVVSPRRQRGRSSRGRRGLQGTGAGPGEPGRIRAPRRDSAVCRASGKSPARWSREGFGRPAPSARPVDRHPGNADRRTRPAARPRDIRRHWPTGAEWTLRSVRGRAWSTAVSCCADPGPGFARPAAGPHHPVPRRRSAAPFLDARRARRFTGVVVALGGAPIELVVATDMCLQFLQVTVRASIPLPGVREDRASHQGA